MSGDFLAKHPGLTEVFTSNGRGGRYFSIDLPKLPAGRELRGVVLAVPAGFPAEKLEVRVSTEHVLQVPHVESDGKICFEGDVGPGSGLSPEDRVDETLTNFFRNFVKPWAYGELDGDFAKEARIYWALFVERRSSTVDSVKIVYTTSPRPDQPRSFDASLVKPSGWVLFSPEEGFSQRIISSLGERASQVINASVLQIPIAENFTPHTWPKTMAEVGEQLKLRLPTADAARALAKPQKKPIHRVVVFSSPSCDYAYLLPGGPPNVNRKGKSVFLMPVLDVVPLNVGRLDPSWTYGRDQHVQVNKRQDKHVVVFGAGALGSYVIDQLAKAGVGKITVVDDDVMESANVGRHLLGVNSVGIGKAKRVCGQVGQANPACVLVPESTSAQTWLRRMPTLKNIAVDMYVDLTGEPSVRAAIEAARRDKPVPLLIAWMEPFVAAAHACQLTAPCLWLDDNTDKLESLEAVTWPPDVMRREPACSSEFQAYTSAAAVHAVALAAEAAIELLDGHVQTSKIKSWVRGVDYLQRNHKNLALRDWAVAASPFDGVILERAF